MNHIRPFLADDIPGVSDLFQRVFRKTDAPPPAALKTYFRDIYLDNPWRQDDLPSLVLEERGQVHGFLGSLLLPFSFGGKTIWTRIGGNFMVDPRLRDPFAGVRLLKRFLTGSQDLAMTDTGNEIAKDLWSHLGAVVAGPESMQWIRFLRPFAYLGSRNRNTGLALLFTISKPVTHFADSIVQKAMGHKPPAGSVQPLTIDHMMETLVRIRKRTALVPDYTSASLTWLLEQASQKREFGELHRQSVVDQKGIASGWFMYYGTRNGPAQVLQFFAEEAKRELVVDHLFEHAKEHGCSAVIGRADLRSIGTLSRKKCLFLHRNSYFLMHAKNRAITQAILEGDAFLTRLEGEWWTRFQGDEFQDLG